MRAIIGSVIPALSLTGNKTTGIIQKGKTSFMPTLKMMAQSNKAFIALCILLQSST